MARSTGDRRQISDQAAVRRVYRVKKRTKPAGASRLIRLFYALGFLLVLAAIVQASYGFLTSSPYFRITKLEVEGVGGKLQKELNSIARKAIAENRSLLTLDISRLRNQIASHPGIRNLHLEKLYPDTLIIKASEREPAAVVYADNFYLVDRDGYAVSKIRNQDLPSYQFPVITGLSSDEIAVGSKIYNERLLGALDLVRVLKDKNPELCASLSEIHLGSDPIQRLDNLTAVFKGGLEVRFGDKNPVEKLPALDYFLKSQKDQHVDPFREMAYVDLRFSNQIVYMDVSTMHSVLDGEYEKLKQDQEQLEKNSKNSKIVADDESTAEINSNDSDSQKSKPEQSRPSQSDEELVRQRQRRAWPEPLESPRRQVTTLQPNRTSVRYSAPQYENPKPESHPVKRALARFAFWRRDSEPQNATANPASPYGAQ
jgi:cell division protein FtsQ